MPPRSRVVVQVQTRRLPRTLKDVSILVRELARSPTLRRNIGEPVTLALASALAAFNKPLGKPADDLRVTKVSPNAAAQTSQLQAKARFAEVIGAPRLERHRSRSRDRRISMLLRQQYGRPSGIPLGKVFRAGTSGKEAIEVTPVLQQIDGAPSPLWVTRLREASVDARRLGQTQRADALGKVIGLLEREAKRRTPALGSKQHAAAEDDRLLSTLARVSLARSQRHAATAVLPNDLPSFPPSPSARISELLLRARTHGSRAARMAYLERQAAVLSGSTDDEQRQLSRALRTYLRGYKERWADGWIRRRFQLFSGAQPLPWTVPIIAKTNDREVRRAVEQHLATTLGILHDFVHPALLRQLPAFSVEIGSRGPCYVERSRRLAGYNLGVDMTLHEFGHHLQRYSPHVFATELGVRDVRAYGDSSSGFSGSFLVGYMGRD